MKNRNEICKEDMELLKMFDNVILMVNPENPDDRGLQLIQRLGLIDGTASKPKVPVSSKRKGKRGAK